MSKLMELVDEYGFECRHRADDEKRLLSEIRAAVAELERDAARYRWLKSEEAGAAIGICTGLDAMDYGASGVIGTYDEALIGELADKVIDAAMETANVPER